MKCFLSVMPELKLGLNEKLGDMTFNQCVNLAAFESKKVVTCVTDGEFELMKYRVQDGINVPFKVSWFLCGDMQLVASVFMVHAPFQSVAFRNISDGTLKLVFKEPFQQYGLLPQCSWL
eukprot:evm.model.scf_1411.2 EVM.evm.TU.scf_1411.2   scf_1411:8534-8890(+)